VIQLFTKRFSLRINYKTGKSLEIFSVKYYRRLSAVIMVSNSGNREATFIQFLGVTGERLE